MITLKKYTRQVEAIGILLVLIAAYFQFQADGSRRDYIEDRLQVLEQDLQYSRQKNSELFKCTADHSCELYHYDFVRPEADIFISKYFDDPEPFWRSLRKLFFFIGSILIVTAKLSDWPFREKIMKHPMPWNR